MEVNTYVYWESGFYGHGREMKEIPESPFRFICTLYLQLSTLNNNNNDNNYIKQ